MRMRHGVLVMLLVIAALGAPEAAGAPAAAAPRPRPNVFQATVDTTAERTPELSTDEFKAFLSGRGVVLDARPKLDFELAHVPGSICIEETGLLRIVQTLPSAATAIAIYADGPFSERTGVRAAELLDLGYPNVSRYQLGLAVWRALGNTAETTLEGLRRIFHGGNAVLLDARSRAEYAAGTIPGAESVLAGEVATARNDRRLQYYDHATRIVVFGNTTAEARAVADEIARHAYSNSSFFGGSYQELKRARFFSERKPSPSNLEGLPR